MSSTNQINPIRSVQVGRPKREAAPETDQAPARSGRPGNKAIAAQLSAVLAKIGPEGWGLRLKEDGNQKGHVSYNGNSKTFNVVTEYGPSGTKVVYGEDGDIVSMRPGQSPETAHDAAKTDNDETETVNAIVGEFLKKLLGKGDADI